MKKVAVFFGGRSAEHEVSIITAHFPIIQSLQASGQYEVWPVYISKKGEWYCETAFNDLEYFKQSDFESVLAKVKPVQISLSGGLSLVWTGLRTRTVEIDIAFPAMHGTYGEDGSLMGLLRLANIPFVGCDMAASVIAMDKVVCKQVTEPQGIPSVPYIWFTAQQWTIDASTLTIDITKKLQFPVFVKPVHLGSSIGISRVEKASDLQNAIEVALHYDDKVIVEQGVANLIEVTLPIMGNQDLQLAHIEQPLAGFFDFDEKYLKGNKAGGVNSQYSNIPAQISEKLAATVTELGIKTYRAIEASGIARIDFLIDGKTEMVYMNEINTLPGSLYHHNWRQKGVSGVELVTTLVRLAEERFQEQRKLTHTFSSNILQKVGGPKTGPLSA